MVRVEGFAAPDHPHYESHDLFDQASKFQSWHLSYANNLIDHTHTIEVTSKIMQISESIPLAEPDKARACQDFTDLSDDLTYGATRLCEMPARLEEIKQHLTDAHPGAKLIDLAMSLQYRTMHEFNPEQVSLLKPHFDTIYEKAGSADALHLEALSRTLAEMLKQNHPPDTLSSLLESSIHEYL